MYISIKEIKQMVTFYFKALDFLKLKYSWIYSIVLVSVVQQSDSVILYILFFRLFSIIDYYKIIDLLPPRLNLFLGILLFLMQLWNCFINFSF